MSEKSECIFDPEYACRVIEKMNSPQDFNPLDKISPAGIPKEMSQYLEYAEKIFQNIDNKLSILPRFCDVCLRHELRKFARR